MRGVEYGAGETPALPAFVHSLMFRKGCAGWCPQKKLCCCIIKDLKCQNPEELVEILRFGEVREARES